MPQNHQAWSLRGGLEGTRPLELKVLIDAPLGFTSQHDRLARKPPVYFRKKEGWLQASLFIPAFCWFFVLALPLNQCFVLLSHSRVRGLTCLVLVCGTLNISQVSRGLSLYPKTSSGGGKGGLTGLYKSLSSTSMLFPALHLGCCFS